MTENFSWSAGVGRWLGIPIRLHLFLLLFVAAIFAFELNLGSGGDQRIGSGTGVITVGILLASITIHELAHLLVISRLGGKVDAIVFMPWGGNSDFVLPSSPRVQGAVFIAGPLVNGIIFAIGATILVQFGNTELTQLINPFRPHEFNFAEWQFSFIRILSWINFQLLIVNLIPCFPFDGAQLVRTVIRSINDDVSKTRIESAVMVMGHAVAFAVIGLALLIRDYNWGPIHWSWILLLLSGIVMIFSARFSFHEQTRIQQDEWKDQADSEFDSYYDENTHPSFDYKDDRENLVYSQWLTEKRKERVQQELHSEEEDYRLADEILKRLHGDGLDSLSDGDRLILDRVSARIRRRRQQGVEGRG